ncbi:3-deoxy-D-manno-octulosonic acid kinase [Lysobacter pythonis]|uniref:3-deoxy-D-manno-octulosonic acid kinase n=1 Tax=Solilutibacter pythonis TaxID=2483112 RepID=A0A3M2I5D1_9GAMM|nr:3-deoxy-D-manno-octulosonic acid kinase [Lysobacter pythonis]RMH94759.1 3-deoxy-D-manno-octulosonic acid kinase [Lysobacter pythonis]
MPMRDANETVLPFRDALGEGAIVFDPRACPQTPAPAWFDPAHWGEAAQPVGSGGRGAAWFVDARGGAFVLRHYLRGGLAAWFSHDAYLWRHAGATRSFAEFRLLQALRGRGLPAPAPIAALYRRRGRHYRAAILLARIDQARSFGQLLLAHGEDAPWPACGALIARFHRAGLDHADLNAHNLLFDAGGTAWMIDFDKSRLRPPAATWQQANLARLRRSLEKIGGAQRGTLIDTGFARLRTAYDEAMA